MRTRLSRPSGTLVGVLNGSGPTQCAGLIDAECSPAAYGLLIGSPCIAQTDADGPRTTRKIRQLSHRLHPSVIRVSAAAGLRSLRDFYESLLPVELEIGDEAAALEEGGISVIPEEPRLAVYRITQLALTNVARHAEATLCTIGWNYELKSRELVLTIVDDGVGFGSSSDDEAGANVAESNSLGLVTMNDYADALGGLCLITSEPGKGTRAKTRNPPTVPALIPLTVLAQCN